MPHDCHSRARPISTAKSAGWANEVPQGLRGLPAGVEDRVQQRARQQCPVDASRALAHGLGEHRLGIEQFARHPRVLAALPGEEPRRRRRVGALTAHHARPQPVGHQIVEQHPGFGHRVLATTAARCSKCERPAPAR